MSKASGYTYQAKRIVGRGINYIKRNGVFSAFKRMADKADKNRLYNEWRHSHPAIEECEEIVLNSGIKFSIVTPLYKTDKKLLKDLVDSWMSQTYQNFEICFADASSDDDFETYVKSIITDKVKYRRLSVNKGISANTNEAISDADGDFIVFCDHDDIVEPDALYLMAKAIVEDNETDFIYTNQDKIDSVGKKFYDPFLKPAYDEVLLCSTNYICHLHAVRKNLLDEIGYLDPEFDGSQDYEMTLRACEKARKIKFIDSMSYHWRINGNSTADEGDQKLYAYDAGKKAITQHYERLGIDAKVSMKEGTYGVYHTEFSLPEDWEDNISRVKIVDGVVTEQNIEKDFVLFESGEIKATNPDVLKELAGYVMVLGENACGAIAEYPFDIPPKGMSKVDIATFYLTVCPNKNMPVTADLILVKKSALEGIDLTKKGWQKEINDVVYNPFALPQDPIKI